MAEDEVVGWHHQLSERESEQTPGDSEGQGSLACCSLWGHRVGHGLVTEQQQETENPWSLYITFSASIPMLHNVELGLKLHLTITPARRHVSSVS